ncbi:hypothetical protein CDV58_08321 [Aspergillus fumigatus]|nr:hypothetical protein CDV58_08321 [Aspergillus fumigatus]
MERTIQTLWTGMPLPNPNGCWDWVGWYGANADQVGGVQMAAIVNQVARVVSGYGAGSSSSTTAATPTTTTGSITTTTTTTATVTTTAVAPLYGQCGGIGWTGPTACATGVCTAYSPYYAQCLLIV